MRSRSLTLLLGLLAVLACSEKGTQGPTAPPPQPPQQPPVLPPSTPAPELPRTGLAVPGMASYDALIPPLMMRHSIPGGAVAVVKDGRLVFARGYGYADLDAREPVQPDALFRIASVSKPLTAVTVMKLAEEGRLDLAAPAFSLLPDLRPAPGVTPDARLAQVRVINLLEHNAGWDRDRSGDPMFRSIEIAQAMGEPAPASAETVIRYMRGRPLDFDPGTRYVYSNLGYSVLGRIIERVTGQRYEEYVRTAVLAPMGVRRMRIGRTAADQRAAGEVRYYGTGNEAQLTGSVLPGGGTVPWPYGGFYLEALDAVGGWIGSTVDLLRFLTAVDGLPTRPDFLGAATIQDMIARPAGAAWATSPFWYAKGWLVRPAGGDANWWHDGSLAGTTTLLVRANNGLAWAAFFNARNTGFFAELDAALWTASQQVTAWPSHDLFAQFP